MGRRTQLVDVDAFGVGVQMLKCAWFDARSTDKAIDFMLLQANDPAEFIGRKLTLINEFVEGPQRHAKARSSVVGGEPADFVGGHNKRYLNSTECFTMYSMSCLDFSI